MIFTRSDVSFSKADLVALLAHASKDETRAHLAAVHFDANTGRAFASDGHRMAIRKGDKPMHDAVSAAMAVLQKNGEYDKILAKWHLENGDIRKPIR